MRKNKRKRFSLSVVELIEPRRLLSAGTLDPIFGSGGEVKQKEQIAEIAGFSTIDPATGNAFSSGVTIVNNTTGNGFIEEFNSTGVLDPSFGNGGVLSPIFPASITPFFQVNQQIVQPDGKILMLGDTTASYTPVIARLNANGTPDTTFGTNGIAALPAGYTSPIALGLQSSGDVLISDNTGSNGESGNSTIYRLTSTGTLDTTFGTNGFTAIAVAGGNGTTITSFTSDPSGTIIASGYEDGAYNGEDQAGLIARLNANGGLDTSFNNTGYVTQPVYTDPEDEENTPVLVATAESDGTILTANSSDFGENSSNTILFYRYNADGTPDASFGTNGMITSSIVIGAAYATAPVSAVAQTDGKIIIGTTINKDFYNAGEAGLVRINPDGSLDGTFGSGGYSVTPNGGTIITALAVSNSDQVYANVTGDYPSSLEAVSLPFDEPPTRFDSNGAIDTTYGKDGEAIGIPNFKTGEALAVLPNGQSLVAGIVVVGNQTAIYVQRYNNDGSLDTTFAPGAGLGGSNGYTFLGINNVIPESGLRNIGIQIDSQGRIIVGGNFNNGTNNAEFFRLNANGTIDSTFGDNGMATPVVGVGSSAGTTLQQFTLDSSNRIVATANGSNLPVFRLTANGAMDTTFGSGGVADADPSAAYYYQSTSIALAANGQLLTGESSKSGSNATPQLAVARLNSNGSIDTTFGTAGLAIAPLQHSGDSAAATTLTVMSNGDILAGGAETVASTGGISVVVARFLPTGKLDTAFGTSGEFIDGASPIALQVTNANHILVESDGKLLITGTYLYGGHAQTQEFSVIRLTANGALDSTFGSGGHIYTNLSSAGYPSTYLLNSEFTPNGDLEVVGDFYQGFALVRYQLAVPAGTGSVSGDVFNDINGDGLQNSGEAGLSGVTVYDDLNGSGSYVSGDPSTTTSSTGTYVLNGLPAGTSVIREVLKSGYRQSTPATGAGDAVTISSTPATNANFGATTRLLVSGTITANGVGQGNVVVYADLNNDGKFESNENNKTTALDGSFTFQSLSAGTYTFRAVAPAGYVQSVPANNAGITVTLGSGGIDTAVSFSFVPASASTKLTGTVIGTAGSYQNDGNTIAKVFDGNLTDYFDGPTANGDYAGLDLGSIHIISQILYTPRAGYAARMIGGIFQGSNSSDFSSGVVNLYTISTTPTQGILNSATIANYNAFRYVRYLAPAGSYGDVAELEFYGSTLTTGATLESNGLLLVNGTSGPDTIDVTLSGGDDSSDDPITVNVNGNSQMFTLGEVKQLIINAGAGDDNVGLGGGDDGSHSSFDQVFNAITVNGGDGNDTLSNSIQTESGDEDEAIYMDGGAGNDSLYNGGDGVATLIGGDGNDTFSADGYPGLTESVYGGDGDDTYLPEGDTYLSVYDGGTGNNSINFTLSPTFPVGPSSNDIDLNNYVNVHTVVIGDGGDQTVVGSTGNDTITGNADSDDVSIVGGGGNDNVSIIGANTIVVDDSGLGVSNINVHNSGDVSVMGGNGNDTINIRNNTGLETVDGGPGIDTAYTDPGATVKNVEFLNPDENHELSGTVIGTAGSYQNDGNTIAKAFDGNLTNYFDGPTANGDYAGLNLGTAKVITQIGYDPRTGYASRMVGGIFQGSSSASFSNAVTLYTVTAAPANDTLTMVNISNSTAFQYVRYLAPNGSYGDVGELAFYGTTPTTPTKVTGTAIGTAGSYRNHGTTIANAFDGNLATFFDGPDASGDWVGLDLGTSQIVTQVKYAPRSGYEGRMVGGEIQASNTANFSSGVATLFTISQSPTAGVLTTQSLTNSTAYRYYRYIGPANSYCDIAELEFAV